MAAMARCLQTLLLAREWILEPQFCSIEEYLGSHTAEYYDVLAEVGQGAWTTRNDARPWIRFCLTAHYRQAQILLRRTAEINRLWDELEVLVNQIGLPDRMIYALADAAMGLRVRNATYRSSAEVSENLASRDLKALVEKGLLVADGQTRGRAYIASDAIQKVRSRTREPKKIIDPVYRGARPPHLRPGRPISVFRRRRFRRVSCSRRRPFLRVGFSLMWLPWTACHGIYLPSW
jgi:hypothetical protein